MEELADRRETTKNEHSIANCGIKDIFVVIGFEVGLEYLLYHLLRSLLIKHPIITIVIDCTFRFGILYLWVVKHKKVRFSELGFASDRKRIGLGILVGISVLSFYYLILRASMYPAERVEFKFLCNIRHFSILLLWMVIVGLGPFFEEIYYRGFIYQVLRQKWGISRALILQSIFFASMHIPKGTPPSLHFIRGIDFLKILFLGIIFTLLFQKTKSLWTSISTHSTYNLLNTLLYLILHFAQNSPPT